MKFIRKSIISGVVREMDLPVTEEQYEQYENGMFVQDAFPQLTADEREFIISGITSNEWDEMIND